VASTNVAKTTQTQPKRALTSVTAIARKANIIRDAYNSRLPISTQKYKDLTDLCKKGTISAEYQDQYRILPCSGIPDSLAETDEEDNIDE